MNEFVRNVRCLVLDEADRMVERSFPLGNVHAIKGKFTACQSE